MIATATILATLALDTFVGELPERLHPVAVLGRGIARLDREWPAPRTTGLVIAALVPTVVALGLGALTAFTLTIHPIVAGLLATMVLFSTTSLRSLLSAATTVVAATETDLEAARSAAPALVGRETAALSASDLRSAAVESVAENLADGLVAPLSAFALGALLSLPAAVAAAAFVKVVNTLDSMLGYRDRPVGWASARLDDVVMWLPARATAVVLALVTIRGPSPRAFAVSPTRVRPWAGRPASPNSGWPMATMAAALDVRLEKPGAYVLNADADAPTVASARDAVRVAGLAGVVSFALAGVVAWF